jgi:hypothetical protein
MRFTAIMSPRLAVLLLSAALLSTGCQVTTDLGSPCVLQKRGPQKKDANGEPLFADPETKKIPVYEAVDIRERELTPGQDYIAFGATDCEDLICVRDADAPANTDYANNPEASAIGYCSRACVQGSGASACEVTNSGVPEALKSRMDCRSLLLDQVSLDKLRAEDPDAYKATFGDTNSPYFCAGNPIP